MTFKEWIETEPLTGITNDDYMSAWLGWIAGQKAERERIKQMLIDGSLSKIGTKHDVIHNKNGNERISIDGGTAASKHDYISDEAYDCMGREALP